MLPGRQNAKRLQMTLARSTVDAVVEWAPSFERALGSFGGVAGDDWGEMGAFLGAQCPDSGIAIRLIDVMDDEFPAGDVNAGVALSSMLELSLHLLGWQVGIPMAERLAPETTAAAPEAPDWDLTTGASCSDLELGLYEYYFSYIESLNDLRPVQVYDWDASEEVAPTITPLRPLETVTESECDTGILKAVLVASADADAVSFAAEVARWELISMIREFLSSQAAGDSSVALSPLCDEATTFRFTITNTGGEPVSSVMIETSAPTEPSENLDDWSVGSLSPGETLTVDSGIERGQDFHAVVSWVDSQAVTHRQNVGLSCFETIGTVARDG